jgi:very-short-patch-repair endonuclease
MPEERRNRSVNARDFARRLRRNQNLVEALLWAELRNGKLKGLKFRRQHPVGPFVVDFYCAEARVSAELDGKTHVGREKKDAERQAWLESQGLLVIRCPNEEIKDGIDELLELLWQACVSRIKNNSG